MKKLLNKVLVPVAAATFLAGCEIPPPESAQVGFRGTGMVTVTNTSTVEDLMKVNMAPQAAPAASADGPKAGDVYENVQVLGDLSVGQFTRLMAAMTEWVSPEQGCAYCHVGANFADDGIYTKIVSRRMIQMTQNINENYSSHVKETGVTCFTCHRGNNVPVNLWFKDTGPKLPAAFEKAAHGQNLVGEAVGKASLPYDPFSKFFLGAAEIRVQGDTALPPGTSGQNIKDAEHTYGLMMHMSTALGVNCSYCHNTRAFGRWDQSPPARVTAWHGIQMVRNLNTEYLEPLGPEYPAYRVGEQHGDAPKASCSTCHNGVSKPLYGAQMAKDYPSLQTAGK